MEHTHQATRLSGNARKAGLTLLFVLSLGLAANNVAAQSLPNPGSLSQLTSSLNSGALSGGQVGSLVSSGALNSGSVTGLLNSGALNSTGISSLMNGGALNTSSLTGLLNSGSLNTGAISSLMNGGALSTSSISGLLSSNSLTSGGLGSLLNSGALSTSSLTSLVGSGALNTSSLTGLLNSGSLNTGAISGLMNSGALSTGSISSLLGSGALNTGGITSLLNSGALSTGGITSLLNSGGLSSAGLGSLLNSGALNSSAITGLLGSGALSSSSLTGMLNSGTLNSAGLGSLLNSGALSSGTISGLLGGGALSTSSISGLLNSGALSSAGLGSLLNSGALNSSAITGLLGSGALSTSSLTGLLNSGALSSAGLGSLLNSGALSSGSLGSLLNSGALNSAGLGSLLNSGALSSSSISGLMSSGALSSSSLGGLLNSGTLNSTGLSSLANSGALGTSSISGLLNSGALNSSGVANLLNSGALSSSTISSLVSSGALSPSTLSSLASSGALNSTAINSLLGSSALSGAGISGTLGTLVSQLMSVLSGNGVPLGRYGDYNEYGQGTDGRFTSLDDVLHVMNLNQGVHNIWLSSFMNMTQQFSTFMMDQIFAIGAFIDAKDQLETQTLMQQMTAEAHHDYQPDVLMCSIGTNMRNLAATDAKAKTNARALDLTMAKREMLSVDTSASNGNLNDLGNRWDKFASTYCDSNDVGGYQATSSMTPVCKTAKGGPADRINKDIDYTRTIENQYTLNADFTGQAPPAGVTVPVADSEDVLSLSRNLFAFRTFEKLPPYLDQEFAQNAYQDMRSVEAMRSVARNSFTHIVGMRTAGSPDATNVAPFMRNVIAQLGVPDAEIDKFLGTNPSYFAQMEVLTHKIYEDPVFFTNLYTTPANISRIGVSLQAIKLMQDRDRYESSLRREMLVSMMLELKVRERQSDVSNGIIGGYGLTP